MVSQSEEDKAEYGPDCGLLSRCAARSGGGVDLVCALCSMPDLGELDRAGNVKLRLKEGKCDWI